MPKIFTEVSGIKGLGDECGWIDPQFLVADALPQCHGMDPGHSFLAPLESEFRDDEAERWHSTALWDHV